MAQSYRAKFDSVQFNKAQSDRAKFDRTKFDKAQSDRAKSKSDMQILTEHSMKV